MHILATHPYTHTYTYTSIHTLTCYTSIHTHAHTNAHTHPHTSTQAHATHIHTHTSYSSTHKCYTSMHICTNTTHAHMIHTLHIHAYTCYIHPCMLWMWDLWNYNVGIWNDNQAANSFMYMALALWLVGLRCPGMYVHVFCYMPSLPCILLKYCDQSVMINKWLTLTLTHRYLVSAVCARTNPTGSHYMHAPFLHVKPSLLHVPHTSPSFVCVNYKFKRLVLHLQIYKML